MMQSRFRWKAILLTGACCAALAVGWFFLHRYQVRSLHGRLLELANRDEKNGNTDRALRFLRQYLLVKGDDADAQARFGVLLEETARTPKAFSDALGVYEQVLLQDATRQDIRMRAAKLNIRFGGSEYIDRAIAHLQTLQNANPEDADVYVFQGDCLREKKQLEDAANKYTEAIKKSPHLLDAYVRLAQVRKQQKSPEKVTGVLADLVGKNPNEFRVYLIRAAFRESDGSVTSLKEAEQDLVEARKLAPNDVAVLLASASQKMQLPKAEGQTDPKSRFDEARAFLQSARQLYPKDNRVLSQLAVLELAAGQPKEALTHLRSALKQSTGLERNRLLWDLATILIDQNIPEESADVIGQMKKGGVPAHRLDFLRAKLSISQSQWQQASDLLETARPLLADNPDLVRQADLLLGLCYEQRGNPDQQLAVYQRAQKLDPFDLAPRFGIINALVASGRLDEAIEECQSARQLPQAAARGDILYARLLLLKTVGLPPSEAGRWAEVTKSLDLLGKANPKAGEIDVLQAEVKVAQGDYDGARKVLEKAKEKSTQDIEPWIAMAGLAAREGHLPEAQKVLEQAKSKFGDRAELREAKLRFIPVNKNDALLFLVPLAEDLDHFDQVKRGRLFAVLAEAFERAGDFSKAELFWQRLAKLEPNQLKVRLSLFDFYLRRQNSDGMEKTLQAIQTIEGTDGPLAHYGAGQLLILRAAAGEKSLLADARVQLNAARAKRPRWSRVPESLAVIAEMEGDKELAVEHLREAVTLGNRQVAVVRGLVEKLMERRLYAEADLVMRKLQEAGPISNYLQKLGAEISIYNQSFDRAIYLAQLAVSGDSKDYRDYLWHGQILGVLGKRKEAESSLQRAIDLAGEVPDPWVALVQLQARSNDPTKAKATIELMKSKFPPSKVSFALAQCYQAINDKAMAEKAYHEALATQSNDLAMQKSILQSVAIFQINNGNLKESEGYLRQLLDPKLKGSDDLQLWARRNLAFVLGIQDNSDKQREALTLVEVNLKTNPANVEDQLVKGVLLAAKKERLPEAIKILETAFKATQPTADQMFILANLYNATGDWPKARDTMVKLLSLQSKYEKQTSYLVVFIDKLMAHYEISEAAVWLSRLQESIKNNLETKESEANDPLAKRLGQATSLLSDLVRRHPSLTVKILPEDAPMFRSVAGKTGKKESLLAVADFLGHCQRLEECLDLCEQVVKDLPPKQVVAVAVAAVSRNAATPKQIQRVESWVKIGRDQKPELVEWDYFLAVLKERQAKFSEAETLYRNVLGREPNNVMVLNNLAFLLGLQGKGEEAYGLIAKAIDKVGPAGELLDSRAVILRAQGKLPEAEKDLRESLRQEKSAYRLFHLVQVEESEGKTKESIQDFGDVIRLGLRSEILHLLERDSFEKTNREYEEAKKIKGGA